MSKTTAPKERPVIMTGESVRAILDGRKTQTRRVMKPQPVEVIGDGPAELVGECRQWLRKDLASEALGCLPFWTRPKAPCKVSDRLWVRETFVLGYEAEDGFLKMTDADGDEIDESVFYRADDPDMAWLDDEGGMTAKPPWKPPMFMPRWASRLTLEITEVRVQRLQEIGVKDAEAEGVEWNKGPLRAGHTNPISAYKSNWNAINGKKHPWESNPWAWAVTFKRAES